MKKVHLPMKRAMRAALLVLLLCVAGLTNATAQTFTVGDLNYSINEDGVSVTVTGHVDGRNASGELVIPESVELYGTTYPVTAIGQSAFEYSYGLTGFLVIPNSVITIGSNAFQHCTGFTSLTLGSAVQTINGSAFYYCSGLTGTLTIPESVTSLGMFSFNSCAGFTTLNYDAINCAVGSWIDASWIQGTNFTSLNIGDNVQAIPDDFLNDGLTTFTGELVIPESVTSIGNNAFNGCTGFTSLNMGNSVTSIGNSAFNGCTGFTGSLNLGNSTTSIGENAFNGCSGFTGSLTIPNSVSNISTNAFSGCSGFSGTLTIGNSVTQIGNSAFFGTCEGFTSFDVKPETPPTLGTNVFVSADYGIPVQVPCGSLDAYSNASGWEVFTNIQEPNPCLWDITATANPSEGGTVSSAGTYEQGSTCTLTATPNEDYVFVNWTEDGEEVSADASYSFTVTGNRDLVANFRYIRYEITVSINPEVGGMVTGGGSYLEGSTCTLTAMANGGYMFTGWMENGQVVSTEVSYSFIVTNNRELVANFSDGSSIMIGDGGTTTNQYLPSYNYYNYTLTQQIYTASEIGWIDEIMGAIHSVAFFNGGSTKTRNYDIYLAHTEKTNFDGTNDWIAVTESDKVFSGVVTMVAGEWTTFNFDTPFVYDGTSNVVLVVDDNTGSYTGSPHMQCRVFAAPSQAIRVYSDDTNYDPCNPSGYNGTLHNEKNQIVFGVSYAAVLATVSPVEAGSVSGIGTFNYGETCTLIATPVSDNYVFVNWTEDGEVVSSNAQYSFTVTDNRILVANFVQVRFDITASANPEEGGTIEGAGNYMVGQTCTLTATPNEGYNFVNWTENGEEVTTETSYSFTVAGNRELEANFAPIPYTITATPNPIEGGYAGFDNEGYQPQYDFDDGSMQGWTTIDADGDGYGWELNYGNTNHGNNGSNGFAFSRSWDNDVILYPDNYLVSPQIILGGYITFYACAQANGWAAEHFGVAVSTSSNNDPNAFTTIQEWTMSAKGVGAPTDVTRSGNRAQGNWYKYTVNLGDYAGQTGYIAIRHFNCWDMFWLNIDDISILPEVATETYLFGSTCTVTAIPEYGYVLESWTENGNVVSNDEVYSFTVTGDVNLVANFVKVPFSITATPNFEDWGTVSGAGEYVIDSVCTLMATPAEGHTFVRWLENGEVVSTDAEYTFTVAGPRDLVAVFSPMEGTYIVFADPNVEAICMNHWDTDGDGFLSYDEAAAVTNLNQVFYYNREITSFDELQYFTGLTFINEYEFYTCQNLTSIIIPESVTSIGRQAFLECYSLGGTLTINENVTYIGWGAFYYTNFSTLNYNAINCEMGGQWLDAATSSLTSLNIGENVEVIPHRAFRNCYNVTGELVIPNSVTYIEAYAFEGCSGFTSITIPEGITSIEERTFAGCSSAETINLPSTLESIGYSAFSYCNSLTSIELPSTVNYIGASAFDNCSSLLGTLEIPMLVTSIEDETFMNCTSLTGLVLPENLQYIGIRAFQNCSGLRGEITLPETLESVGSNAFDGCDGISTVNYNAINCQAMGSAGEPVFYDCAFSHLRIGENVENIPDFAFKRCFLINEISSGSVVPPTIYASTFGMVSRSIPVHVPVGSGEAYRNAPYWEEFFNIIEDYSPSQYSCHWSVDPNQFESNMTVIGIIQIDGEEQATDALEIGAFSGGECRGSQMLAYYPEVDRYLVFLTLYGEAGDLLTFRLYDHEMGEESVLGCASYVTYEADGRLGTLAEPYPFNFTGIQVTELPQGWKWWSSYIELTGNDGLAQMEESLGENGLIIKSRNDGFVSNYENEWYGTLTAVDNENTYLIQTAAPCVMTVGGEMAQAQSHPITLAQGWSWIGYPSNRPASVNTALASLEAEDDDMLKSQEGFCVYHPDYGWVGTLHTLTPGMGLMYESHNAADITLAYAAPNRAEVLEKNVTARGNRWEPDFAAYPNNMSVLAVVELDGEELQGGDYELAAFAGGECRGSVKLMQVAGRYMAFLTVFGDEAATLRFGLYDSETGMEVVGSDEDAVFVANVVLGSLDEPYVVRFRGTTGMDEWANRLNVYPNPAASGETFSITLPTEDKALVEIINAMGVVVETVYASSVQNLKVPAVAGVYTLRISVEGKDVCNRKLVVR